MLIIGPQRRHIYTFAAAIIVMLYSATDRAEAGVAYAITADDRLLQFDTSTPGTISSDGPISGLNPFERLLGIDFRSVDPNNLYAVSSFGQSYSINPVTLVATKIGAEASVDDLPLEGQNYGYSFNPTVDRVRLVSDLGENFRLNPNDGTVTATDGALAYQAGDPNAGFPAGVVAVGYTNQDTDPATGTTLYGIDSEAGVLVKIDPPNDGTLTTVGSLQQADLPLFSGLDIDEGIAYGFTSFEGAFGPLPALNAQFFQVDLATGQATSLGMIGDGSAVITGGAVTATAVPVPPAVFIAPLAMLVVGYVNRRIRRRQAAAMD